jgi:hypothetical protein
MGADPAGALSLGHSFLFVADRQAVKPVATVLLVKGHSACSGGSTGPVRTETLPMVRHTVGMQDDSYAEPPGQGRTHPSDRFGRKGKSLNSWSEQFKAGHQMDRFTIHRRIAPALGVSALLVGMVAGPAFAADTITQAITGSGLTASVADLTLTSVGYQNAAHDVTGTMVLTADDSTGSGAGWNVTIQSSAFQWVGTANGGTDIPASKFALTTAAAPTMTSGQAVSVALSTGPQVPPTSPIGKLDTPRKTLVATAAYGAGTYTQALGVTLTIPAMSRVGVYTGTLTTTITSAP